MRDEHEHRINRPAVRNALHAPAHDELEQIWNDQAADDGLWVAILTGSGDQSFSAGHDLKWHAGGGFEIVLCCDLVVASETASFALPEPRVGLAALPRRLIAL